MKSLSYAAMLVCAMLLSSAPAARSEVEIKIPSRGPRTEIATVPVLPQYMYRDTIGFGSGEPNWGGPYQIAASGSLTARAGYDYNYLKHCVWLGDSLIVADAALRVVPGDSCASRMTLSRLGKPLTVDISAPGAVRRIRALVSPPKGWTRESYSYGMVDPEYDEPFGVKRRTLEAELPRDPVLRKTVLKMIDSMLPYPKQYRDTVYVPVRKVTSFRDMVELDAELMALTCQKEPQPLPPLTFYTPMATETEVVAIDYVWESPRVLTLAMTENACYQAGGGRSSQTVYRSFDKRTGVPLSPEKTFSKRQLRKMKKAVAEAIARDRNMTEEEVFSAFADVHCVGPDFVKPAYGEAGWDDLTLPFTLALDKDGYRVNYPGSDLTGFGEDGFWNVFVPYYRVSAKTTRK